MFLKLSRTSAPEDAILAQPVEAVLTGVALLLADVQFAAALSGASVARAQPADGAGQVAVAGCGGSYCYTTVLHYVGVKHNLLTSPAED